MLIAWIALTGFILDTSGFAELIRPTPSQIRHGAARRHLGRGWTEQTQVHRRSRALSSPRLQLVAPRLHALRLSAMSDILETDPEQSMPASRPVACTHPYRPLRDRGSG